MIPCASDRSCLQGKSIAEVGKAATQAAKAASLKAQSQLSRLPCRVDDVVRPGVAIRKTSSLRLHLVRQDVLLLRSSLARIC